MYSCYQLNSFFSIIQGSFFLLCSRNAVKWDAHLLDGIQSPKGWWGWFLHMDWYCNATLLQYSCGFYVGLYSEWVQLYCIAVRTIVLFPSTCWWFSIWLLMRELITRDIDTLEMGMVTTPILSVEESSIIFWSTSTLLSLFIFKTEQRVILFEQCGFEMFF